MFKISITSVPARIDESDLDRSIAYFLSDIGYIPRISPSTDMNSIKNSVYFRLFKECFLMRSDRYWTPEELMAYLNTSRSTLYRHLNKLKYLDILEEIKDGKVKKYRLRSGDLVKAWSWVEINIKMAIENYRNNVEHINSLIRNGKI
ncbi:MULTISPECIES: helix-turn-helix domain-containing protein [unclassified Thermoplasma]|uniref:helix-turn-helix domain-containing protein n=1 Tax=unclassified Thermoplasma TaxID=2684908 RepID=UPI000D9F02D5|nr:MULTISPECIES: helix-turn-helix domain-containing protein [unclassified Thermoplasma]PYB69094.1 transcriptional regulator [Thermoplasma sp. Kam2015]